MTAKGWLKFFGQNSSLIRILRITSFNHVLRHVGGLVFVADDSRNMKFLSPKPQFLVGHFLTKIYCWSEY
jgi:hypothetical protein